MTTSVLRRRVVASATTLALAASGVALTAVAASPAQAAGSPVQGSVSVVKDTSDSTGMTVEVTGTNFDPTLAIGTRAPLFEQQAGTYIVFGKFPETWQPSRGVASSARKYEAQKWASPDGFFGEVLSPSGEFDTTLTLNPKDDAFDGVEGNWGIYTFAASGAVAPSYETYTPLTFNGDLDEFTIQSSVTVSKSALAAGGETITVTGTSFDPSAVKGTTVLPDLPAGAFVLFGRFADVWKPSDSATSDARPYDMASRKWAVLADQVATIGGASAGAVVLSPDGRFTTTIAVDPAFSGVPATGNFGIYTYAGDVGTRYAPFETYTPITFAAPAPVKKGATVKLTTTKATYGTSAKATAVVTAAGTTPTGTVTLKNGAAVLGSATIAGGRATFTLPRTLKVGNHTLAATYSGDANVNSAGATVRVSVAKATASTTFKLAKKKVKKAKRGKVTVRVKATGVTPTGKLVIRDGKKKIKTVTLKAGKKGKITITLPKLKKGKHKISVQYRGSSTVKADTSTKKTLRVV